MGKSVSSDPGAMFRKMNAVELLELPRTSTDPSVIVLGEVQVLMALEKRWTFHGIVSFPVRGCI